MHCIVYTWKVLTLADEIHSIFFFLSCCCCTPTKEKNQIEVRRSKITISSPRGFVPLSYFQIENNACYYFRFQSIFLSQEFSWPSFFTVDNLHSQSVIALLIVSPIYSEHVQMCSLSKNKQEMFDFQLSNVLNTQQAINRSTITKIDWLLTEFLTNLPA